MVTKQVMTMANCIVGVSVLAMPFCFKQCGVVLASVLLLLSGIMTRTVCYFLLKASTITRRRTYELLAYHTFGQAGKLVVEISIIGFLFGTLIAFLVVMGDLGPEIMSDVFSVENNSSLRTIIMTALSLFVALPLGLLRNIDSLTGVSTLTMLFYLILVGKIFSEGIGPLWSGSFLTKIHYWRPAGVLQCIPIFSMALSCQTQIFGIYDSLPEPSLPKMNEVVKKAINMCTAFYISVGFLGYIAFCTENFGGNILLSFKPSGSTHLIKLCFILSIAFSFPLVIFPCRASLHSLIFKRVNLLHHAHDITTNYIPESRLKLLTIGIIGCTLFVGLMIPNIELVLGLVGSTTGSVICIIFPAVMFIRVTSKNTTERILAQTVFFIGVSIMVVTTYVTLYAVEQAKVNVVKLPEPDRVTEVLRKLPPVLNNAGEKDLQNPVVENLVPERLPEFSNDRVDKNFVNLPKKDVDIPKKSVSTKPTKPAQVDKASLKNSDSGGRQRNEESLKNSVDVKPAPISQENIRANVVQDVKRVEEKQHVDLKPEIEIGQLAKEQQPQKQVVGESNNQGEIPPANVAPVVKKQDDNVKKPVNAPSPPQNNIPKNLSAGVNAPNFSHQQQQHSVIKNQSAGVISPSKPASAKQINPEDFLLQQLKEHEKEQKKLLEEQKEILAKLKQHQADDELKEMQKENKINDQQNVLNNKENFVKQEPPQQLLNKDQPQKQPFGIADPVQNSLNEHLQIPGSANGFSNKPNNNNVPVEQRPVPEQLAQPVPDPDNRQGQQPILQQIEETKGDRQVNQIAPNAEQIKSNNVVVQQPPDIGRMKQEAKPEVEVKKKENPVKFEHANIPPLEKKSSTAKVEEPKVIVKADRDI